MTAGVRLKEALRIYAQKTNTGKVLWSILCQVKQIAFNEKKQKRIPRSIGVSGFLQTLNKKNCRYVVLRWYESLPDVAPGEDIDILVHDEDVSIIDNILVRSPSKGGVKCDVYSVTGQKNFSYKGIAYYPPLLGERILANARKDRSGAYIPSNEDYFYSLCFHAIYHKGYQSGLPEESNVIARMKNPEHDYAAILEELARRNVVDVDINLNSLDRMLDQNGWRPPLDMLERLGYENEWCRILANRVLEKMPLVPGLVVFVVREQASSAEEVKQIVDVLNEHGFIVIRTKNLKQSEAIEASKLLRGGNWGHKSSVMEGGLPAVLIVAIASSIVAPSIELNEKVPFLDNANVVEAKLKIREIFFKHIIHSTDNAKQAAHYLSLTMPEDMDSILAQARTKSRSCS